MKLSVFSINQIGSFIAGNDEGWPYRSGPELVKFFNGLGFREVYGSGFPSRAAFAKEKIAELNSQAKLKDAIREMLDPRLWLEPDLAEYDIESCINQVNELLKYDGYGVVKDGNFYKVRELAGAIVEVENRFEKTDVLSELLIEEQIKKCKDKIDMGDYSGAITNARTLIETVCMDIEYKLNPNPYKNDGDLMKLFNSVRELLNLDPRIDISNALKQVIGGLTSIVNGISTMRNKMSDAHGVSYKPDRHHAKLAVNSAKTLADFLFDTMTYQIKKGTINVINK